MAVLGSQKKIELKVQRLPYIAHSPIINNHAKSGTFVAVNG